MKQHELKNRLDVVLSEQTKQSRSQAQKMIRLGHVLVNGKPETKTGFLVSDADNIVVQDQRNSAQSKTQNNDISHQIDIVAETDDYVTINKPSGLLVHPTEANEPNTLVDWLLDKYPNIKDVGENATRPGIVHRLDKDASGVMVVAKTQAMFDHLKKQFQSREVKKEYLVLVYGHVLPNHDTIDFAIDRGKDGRMAARPMTDVLKLKNVGKVQDGREAKTEFFVEKRLKNTSLLRVTIHTGRTHQIRVHLFAYNHPVVGDTLYFQKQNKKYSDRLFLHAAKLCFKDLALQEQCFEAPLPQELVANLETL